MHPSTLAKRVHFLIFLFIGSYFYGLGSLPLLGPDEPRYAQVAREMLLRSDLITPTLGGHPWFEKPALLYWMEIAAFKIFGVTEWAARLGPAICGILTIAAVTYLLRSATGTSATQGWQGLSIWTELVATTSLGLIVFSRGASFDIVITMTIAWALVFFLLAELTDEKKKQLRYLIGFYSFVGLSLLAKGLVGIVIPFGVVGLYYLLSRTWPSKRISMSLCWGIPLALIVAAIWYGPVIYRNGWHFINEFFVQHHFARYLSNKYHHPQPFYFYPVILLLLTLPWMPFLVEALIKVKDWSWRTQDRSSRLLIFTLAWLLFPILFFSFSGSKLPGYILPVLPAAFILIGTSVAAFQYEASSTWPMNVTGLLCLAMGLGGLGYGLRVAHLPIGGIVLSAAPFIIAGATAIVWRKARFAPTLIIASSVILTIVFLSSSAAPILARRESTRDLLRLADARGYSNLRVLAIPGGDRSAEFYASGRVIYGPNGEVTPIYDAAPFVADARKRGERLLAFVAAADLNLYRTRSGIEIIGDNGKLALLCLH